MSAEEIKRLGVALAERDAGSERLVKSIVGLNDKLHEFGEVVVEKDAEIERLRDERIRQAELFARLRSAMGWRGEESWELVEKAFDLKEERDRLTAEIERLRTEALEFSAAQGDRNRMLRNENDRLAAELEELKRGSV